MEEFRELLSKNPDISICGAKNNREIVDMYKQHIQLLMNKSNTLFDKLVDVLKEKTGRELTEREKDVLTDYLYNDFLNEKLLSELLK